MVDTIETTCKTKLNTFWFITNKSNDRYDKVLKSIELAILSPKRVKYRDVMSSKSTK